MAREITGIAGRSGISSTALTNSNLENKKETFQLVKVIDIILDSSHTKFKQSGGFSSIGAIFYSTINNPTSVVSSTAMALPFDATIKQYPLVDEFVLIIDLQGKMGMQDNKVFYLKPLSLYNTLNHNAFPSFQPSSTNNSKNYQNNINDNTQIEQIEPQPLTPKFDSSLSTPSNPFIEQSNIRTLTPSSGDVIIEGRNGQSIRFSNKKGNPITLLRNGQDRTIPSDSFDTIKENIKNDLSSIYLTSNQNIQDLLFENVKFVSYSTPPTPTNDYNEPQVILNSNRIVIEAETDSIFLNSNKSVGLFSQESINIESTDVNIHSSKIRLGSKNAEESVLLGDKTYDIIDFILNSLQQITQTLAPDQLWPAGVPVPNAAKMASSLTIDGAITQVKSSLLPNIKSSKVKVE